MDLTKIVKKLLGKVSIKPSKELHETVTPGYLREQWQEKAVEQIREDHKLKDHEKVSQNS